MENNILITSGYNFEGYSITEYFGFFSGECALGTGFLSTLGAGVADFLGTNSTMYSGKLKEAKEYAISRLVSQVQRTGGNAIIGLDVDYTTFSSDIMGVIVSGTAVKITKEILENDSSIEMTKSLERKVSGDTDNCFASVAVKIRLHSSRKMNYNKT
jgi:uncharacterized protein YbjQ (UPF0145 family)